MKRDSLGFLIKLAAEAWRSFKEGNSIEKAISQNNYATGKERAAIQSIVFFSMRKKALIDWVVKKLVSRAPTEPTRSVLEIAIGLLNNPKENAYTVVNQAVQLVKETPTTKNSANFINAILRRFLREKEQLLQEAGSDEVVKYNAPRWWINRYKAVFGKESEKIFFLQKRQPPMVLRVNRRKGSPAEIQEEFLRQRINAQCIGLDGLILEKPLPVDQVPGFLEGRISVQDAGSQLAARFLDVKDGMGVLDACAAPGGKTAHILELAEANVLALEVDPKRAIRIQENLDRLGLQASIKVADAGKPEQWWDGQPFDRILLDAPCTASGIVRRHPDIPWLRRPEDIEALAKTQQYLLMKLWPLLARGGKMLYSVCSVFDEEGPRQIQRFMKTSVGAKLIPLGGSGETLLRLRPSQEERDGASWPGTHDGFFYALIEKF